MLILVEEHKFPLPTNGGIVWTGGACASVGVRKEQDVRANTMI
jgi:hypothetical protein